MSEGHFIEKTCIVYEISWYVFCWCLEGLVFWIFSRAERLVARGTGMVTGKLRLPLILVRLEGQLYREVKNIGPYIGQKHRKNEKNQKIKISNFWPVQNDFLTILKKHFFQHFLNFQNIRKSSNIDQKWRFWHKWTAGKWFSGRNQSQWYG